MKMQPAFYHNVITVPKQNEDIPQDMPQYNTARALTAIRLTTSDVTYMKKLLQKVYIVRCIVRCKNQFSYQIRPSPSVYFIFIYSIFVPLPISLPKTSLILINIIA